MKWPLLIICAVLAGCATSGTATVRSTSMAEVEKAVGPQQPLEYRQGYRDGCDSGLVSGGSRHYLFQKNPKLYQQDDLYKHGWDAGFSACKKQYQRSAGYWNGGPYRPWYNFGYHHFHRHGC
ncbi:MAG: hypothetical protein ACE5E9_04625 [Nitrospinaceae bacterium]